MYEVLMVLIITCIEGTKLSYIIDIIVIYSFLNVLYTLYNHMQLWIKCLKKLMIWLTITKYLSHKW